MSYQIPNAAIIHELLDNEVILANLDSGIYYSIRGVGVPIWQCLLQGYGLTAISAVIAARYGADFSAELKSFVHELVQESLLIEVEPLNPVADSISWPKEFSAPTLEKYEEMKNLLMLDPIHEVDEQGWPSKSSPR